ncbi:MAG TPA: hypothetical protein VGM54_02765 [Chthoniobacter sp.]|jgi:predicted DNA-binding antitoxin AbrB/MazE fold protein
MSFTATVENGTIKLPPGVDLPDGTEVTVELEKSAGESPKIAKAFAERYGEFFGIYDGPEDFAANHDQYASGAGKRKV